MEEEGSKNAGWVHRPSPQLTVACTEKSKVTVQLMNEVPSKDTSTIAAGYSFMPVCHACMQPPSGYSLLLHLHAVGWMAYIRYILTYILRA